MAEDRTESGNRSIRTPIQAVPCERFQLLAASQTHPDIASFYTDPVCNLPYEIDTVGINDETTPWQTSMHIRDGILSPEVCVVGGALAVAAVGYSLRRLRTELADRTIPLTGMLAAVIFAGQMVNFPLFGLPVSGHLLGGVLAAVVLGPWAGCVALSLVLVVQAILFADGGLLALGVNILNMAVVGAWGGAAVYQLLRRTIGTGKQGTLFSAIISAYLTVLAAAGLFCLEFSLSRTNAAFDLRQISVWMLLFHALIGVGEAGITGAVVAFLLARRPELILRESTPTEPSRYRTAAWGLGLTAAAVAVFASPWASEWEDGLEAVAERTGFHALGVDRPLLLSDYVLPLPGRWEAFSVSLAGLLGTVVVLCLGWILSRWLQRAAPSSPGGFGAGHETASGAEA